MADNPWLRHDVPRGSEYDDRFARLAATGADVHGEANLVAWLQASTVVDAGCGTGRVAIELARRGIDVVGVDLDRTMLAEAERKAPHLTWVSANLADVRLERQFELVVMAGNVMVFLTPGSEQSVVTNMAAHLRPGGLLLAGFSLAPGGLSLERYDSLAAAADLTLVERWATGDREPFEPVGDYAVSLHRS